MGLLGELYFTRKTRLLYGTRVREVNMVVRLLGFFGTFDRLGIVTDLSVWFLV